MSTSACKGHDVLCLEIGDAVPYEDQEGFLEAFDEKKGWLVRNSETGDRSHVSAYALRYAYEGTRRKPNEFDGSWTNVLQKCLILEIAKSYRVRCFGCASTILKGKIKLGIRKTLWVGSCRKKFSTFFD